jgi:hypothetical protein
MRHDLSELRRDLAETGIAGPGGILKRLDRILAIGKVATGPAVATPSCPACGAPMLESSDGELEGCE